MGKNTVDVTDATFDSDVLKSGKTVVVDFWAEWCGPCKMVAPVLDEIAGENKDKITVAKLDIDVNQKTAQAYQVMSIPTMIVFQDGKPVKQIVGARPKAALLSDLADPSADPVSSWCPAFYQEAGHRHITTRTRPRTARCQVPRGGQGRMGPLHPGETSEECMQLLRRGDCSAAVVEIRAMLRQCGLPLNGEDPTFDAEVEHGVRSFQQQRGLISDGIVGPATYRALRDAGWTLGDRMLALMVTAPMTGDDVVTLQERLSELGYDPGRPGGVFDEQTEHALRRFQREYGLVPTACAAPPRSGRCASSVARSPGGGRT